MLRKKSDEADLSTVAVDTFAIAIMRDGKKDATKSLILY
jgi:ribosomal protein S7